MNYKNAYERAKTSLHTAMFCIKTYKLILEGSEIIKDKEYRKIIKILAKWEKRIAKVKQKEDTKRKTIEQFLQEHKNCSTRLKSALKRHIKGGEDYKYKEFKYIDEISTQKVFLRIRNAGEKTWNEFKNLI